MQYIKGLDEKHDCFLCHYRDNPDDDKKNYVLWRTKHSLVIFNRFPYNNGHLLIAPNRHIPDLAKAETAEMDEMMRLIRDAQAVLQQTINPGGFNVGMNFGRCAGAGLPEHMHIHLVPRWQGDTNFMHVCGDTDVISQGIEELYTQLTEAGKKMGLPS